MKMRFRGCMAICMVVVLLLGIPCVGNAMDVRGYVMLHEMQLSSGDYFDAAYDGDVLFPLDQSVNTSILQCLPSTAQAWHVWGFDDATSGRGVVVDDFGVIAGDAMGSDLESLVQGGLGTHYLLTPASALVSGGGSVRPSYEVKFLDYDGNVFVTKLVQQNATLINRMPEKHPKVKEYTFTTWYTDADLTQVFNPATSITKDMVLYSGWEPYEPPVFTAPENGLVMSESIVQNSSMRGKQIVITIGADTMLAYGKEIHLDVPAYMQDGVPMLPVRAILEQIGAKGATLFAWDEADVDALLLNTAMGNYKIEADSGIVSGTGAQLLLNAAVKKVNDRFFMPYDALGRLYNISAKYNDLEGQDTVVLTVETKVYPKH